MSDPKDRVPPEDNALEYRSVHTGSVLGLLLGLVSAVTLFTAGNSSYETTLALAPIPLLGIVVSLVAWRQIAGSPDLYTGRSMAQIGALLSVVFLCTGVGYGGYIYSIEVPEGYARTSFLQMKPSQSDLVAERYIPDEVLEYINDGEQVFIKGYIRPDSTTSKKNFSKFLLVRDNQECCFGDMAKVQYFDQINVTLGPGQTTDYHPGVFRLGGVLKVGPGNREMGSPITYYLQADYHRAPGDRIGG